MKKLFGGNKSFQEEPQEQYDWEYGDNYEDNEEEYYEEESEYAEEYYEDEEYYADEEECATEEYYADEAENEEYFEEDDIEYADDESYYEEDDQEDDWMPEGSNVFSRAWNNILSMSAMDRIVTVTGVAVLVMALVTGAVYVSANILNKQVSSFETIGRQLSGISVIGETGLMAVSDAELARINAANTIDDDETNSYEEGEYVKEVQVALNLTTIQKDLKVKFVNTKTNKLIANVPFSIEVTTPSGEKAVWSDDDMDGIIYKSEIKSGTYKVSILDLEDAKYEDYILPKEGKSAQVKDSIEYKKVDVSDEIKAESEVNAAKEDTKKNETEVESSLQDTVGWVESSKKESYAEVKKADIKEPVVASLNTAFKRLAGETVSISGDSTAVVGGHVSLSTSKSAGEWILNAGGTWSSSDTSIATVDSNGVVTAIAAGTAKISYAWTGMSAAISGGDAATAISGTAEHSVIVTAVAGVTSVTIEPAALAMDTTNIKTSTLTATVVVTGDALKTVTWESSNTAVATVDATGKVTAVAKGTAVITAKSTVDATKYGTCNVTVGIVPTILALDKATLTIGVEGTTKLVATTTPVGGMITWTSDKADIATVDAEGNVKGIKEGTATITATTANGLTAKCVVTVKKMMVLEMTTATVLVGGETKINITVFDDGKGVFNAAVADGSKVEASVKDKVVTLKGKVEGTTAMTVSYTPTTGSIVYVDCAIKVVGSANALTDTEGTKLYVLKDGNYVEAVYSDYYKYDVFYKKAIKYTGWQTIDGKVFFYDANGKKATGEQVIQGAKYNFASDGSLVTGSGTLGIDVSKWNGTIDWNAVKNSGVSYVIIRCGYRGSSEGSLIEDPKFRTNIKGATSAGLKVGIYFFTQAINEVEAVEEASMVINLIKDYKISYPVFLDIETSGGRGDKIDSAMRTKVAKAFCETIQNSGYTAGIYANKTWLTSKMDATQLTKYKIWLAQYAATPNYSATRYDIWQYKSTGRVSGISGDVDMNISYLGY